MPKRSLGLLCALVALALALTSAPARAAVPCANADMIANRDNLRAFARAVVCLIDVERLQRGRRPFDIDSRLVLAGERHASDMVLRDYFSHFTPAGNDMVERLRRVGYLPEGGDWMAGEVLAWGVFYRCTPRATVDAWLASEPHKAALLDPAFQEAGAGAVLGNPVRADDGGVTVAVELGRE